MISTSIATPSLGLGLGLGLAQRQDISSLYDILLDIPLTGCKCPGLIKARESLFFSGMSLLSGYEHGSDLVMTGHLTRLNLCVLKFPEASCSPTELTRKASVSSRTRRRGLERFDGDIDKHISFLEFLLSRLLCL